MAEISELSHVLRQFLPKAKIQSILPFGQGHINDTYIVTLVGKMPTYILQKKNHYVFKNIENMMLNIQKVTDHIRTQLELKNERDIENKVMTYLPANDTNLFYKTAAGEYWTLCLLIKDSITIEQVELPSQAYNTGKAFGIFQKQLEGLSGSSLAYTIPDFHNGVKRFLSFTEAIKNAPQSKIANLKNEISLLKDLAGEMFEIQKLLDSGQLPLRITHNDTKINNVLFDKDENILCIIDLDTVMPGTILFDFGDAIRTICNKGNEDERDISKIDFNISFFESFTDGYLSEAISFLTLKELELLPVSGIYMTWEQAMRFATDYLSGDVYYKIKYPDHNLVRTKAQARYLQILINHKFFMSEYISSKSQKNDS